MGGVFIKRTLLDALKLSMQFPGPVFEYCIYVSGNILISLHVTEY